MNTDELVAYFVNEVAPVYDSLQNNGKKIYCAILQSLPPEILDEVAAKLLCENATAWDLLRLISWIQKDRPGKTEKPNESVTTLLHWYLDKDSKKVCYAYERLTKRYDAQSYSDQQKILRAFLAGGKKSSEWAATKLRREWIPGFEKDIESAWKAYKGSSMARTIIYMMPEEFVMKEQNELLEAASYFPDAYAILCGRLGHNPGFTIDESRLSILDWFYVVGKLGIKEKIPEMDGKVDQYIRNLNADDYVGFRNTDGHSLVYLMGMSRIIWAMKKLHYTEGLVRLARMEQDSLDHIPTSVDIDKRIASAVTCFKSLVDDDLPY